VEYAELNYIYRAFVEPNDPSYYKQWAHQKVQSEQAWEIATGGSNVTIAIIDTGIDENHPDLKNKIVAGYDWVGDDSNPHDLNGHGTHVAGIAAAVTDNGKGIAGMSWGARIMPLRVLDFEGFGYNSDITAAINWAVAHHAEVINLSLGGEDQSQSMQNAINSAHTAGTLVVAAMGNYRDEGNPTMYPAAYQNVMAVASTGPDDIYAFYSQYGSHTDIAAPGGEMGPYTDGIYSTMPTYPVYLTTNFGFYTNYDYLHGTSQASPHVAGLAALLWSADPSLTPDQVQTRIENSAVDLGPSGWDSTYGHGRINAYQTLKAYEALDAPNLYTISNSDGDGSYLVDWSSVSGATSYTLQEDDNQAFTSPKTIYNGANTQYQVNGRETGFWYYRVRASNGNGNSDWSVVRSVSVLPGAPLLAPINNSGNLDAYSVDWSLVSGAIGYTLQEDDNPTFSSPLVRYDGTAGTYSVTGQRGGGWYYRVRSYNQVGQSNWSMPIQSTTVNTPALGEPVLQPISNSDGDGQYNLTWTGVVSATSYTLEQSADPYFSAPTLVYNGSLTQTTVMDQPGGTWHYRVRAFGPPGQGPWSASQSVSVTTWIYIPMIFREFNLSEGFDSQFTSDAYGWQTHSGTWTLENGKYSAEGGTNAYASASFQAGYQDFTYRVRVRREGCATCANVLYIRGEPQPLGTFNRWRNYYGFQYASEGYFSVWKIIAGGNPIEVIDWTFSSAINQGSVWNVLKVTASGNQLSYTINGTLVWQGTDISLSSGRVGFGMYVPSDGVNDNLQVDWATLTASQGSVASSQETGIEVINPGEGVGSRADLQVVDPKK
jgi:hypothetical protein